MFWRKGGLRTCDEFLPKKKNCTKKGLKKLYLGGELGRRDILCRNIKNEAEAFRLKKNGRQGNILLGGVNTEEGKILKNSQPDRREGGYNMKTEISRKKLWGRGTEQSRSDLKWG